MKTRTFTFLTSLKLLGFALVFFLMLGGASAVTNSSPVNLLVNPGFEDGFASGWSNWMPDNNAIETDPASVHGGTKSVALKPVSWSGSGFGQSIKSGFAEGENFTFSAYGKVVGTTAGHISVQLIDADGNKTNFHSADFTNSGAFEMQSLVVEIPAGTVEILPNVWYDNNDGSVLYVDDFSFALTPENILSNPGFENGLTSWGSWGGTQTINTTNINGGINSMQFTGEGGLAQTLTTGLESGATYKLTAYCVIPDGATASTYIGLQTVDAAYQKTTVTSSKITNTSAFEKQEVTMTLPSNTVSLAAFIYQEGGTTTIISDDYTLVKTSSANVAVTGVSVSPATAELAVNATKQLVATILPADASNTAVTWSSSAQNIATVSPEGLVKAIALGTAKITVTTSDGDKTAFSDITVKEAQAGPANLLTNPGFEEASDGYSLWERSAIQTDQVNSGSKAAVVWNMGAPDPGYTGGGLGFEYASPKVGATYTLSAFGKLKNDKGNGANIFIQFKDAGGAKLGIEQASTFAGKAWTMQSVSAVIPENTAKLVCGIWFDGAESDTLYMDDFSLTLDPPNLLTNAGFEEASGGYSLWERSAIQTDNVHSGAKAAVVWNMGAPDPGYTGGGLGYEYNSPLVGGTYTLTAFGKLKNDIGNGANIFIQFKDATGAKLGIEQAPTFAGKEWSTQSVSAVIPENTAKLVCGIWFDGSGSDSLYMDDFKLVLASAPEPPAIVTGTGKNYKPSFITVTGGGEMPDISNGITLNCDGTGATDVTVKIQAALDEAKAAGKPLLIPYTDKFYKISSSLNVSCSVIGVGGMPTIKQTNPLSYSLLLLDDMTGWIYNLHIVGPYDGSPQPPVTNDFGHNIAVRGVNGLTISNNILETPVGDNIGDEGGAQKPVRNMLITNNSLLDPWRCNISATAVVDGVAIVNNYLTYNSQYVDPIDIEPYQDASFVTNIEVAYNDIQSPKPVLTGDGSHYYEAILQVTAYWDPTPGGSIISHHNWGDWGAPFTQVTGYLNGPSTWTNILSINNEEGTTIPGADVQAPAAVAGLKAMDVTKTAIPLTWTAGTDNVGVTGYVVYQDDNLVGLTDSLAYYAAGLTCGTAYGMKVKSYDAAGNTSPATLSYNVATLDCSGGVNLLQNPGFEDGLTSWDDWGGSALETTTIRSGVNSLKIGTGDGGRAQQFTGFTPGATYILSAYGMLSGTGDFDKQSAYIGTQFKDAGGTTLDTQTASITDTTNWQKTTITFTVPENAASVVVYVYYEARGITTNNVLTDDWSLVAFTPVSGITLDPAKVTLAEGIVRQLKTVFSPENASNREVIWSSSDATIASVNSSGLVQGMKVGIATITGTTVDGGKTSTCEVTVKAPAGNMLQNPGIEKALSVGWAGDWGNNKVLATEFHSGTKCLAIGTSDGGRAQLISAIVPGSTYTLSAWGKFIGDGGFAGQAAYIGADIRDASNIRIMIPTAPIIDTLDWGQSSVTFTLPLNAATINVYVYLEARGITTNYVLTDDWGLVSGWTPVPYIPTSVSSNRMGNFKLYPNPLTGQALTIEGVEGAKSISIYDMTGRLVMNQSLQKANNQSVILNENLMKGSYIVKIATSGESLSKLLIVQ